ncbi:bifunctional diguanylate cyclase/phosphodiesterase [Kangiella marina]|uniref:GGDEF domain-containing protein n=1 Tax=Kangiella marina TaxID=1079178 RepID=A0ABP8IJS5_9GAMM
MGPRVALEQRIKPLDQEVINSILDDDYAALLLCNKRYVIKAIAIDPVVSSNMLLGEEVAKLLPEPILRGKESRAIIKLPQLGLDREFLLSAHKLQEGSSFIDRVITLQVLPSLNLADPALKDVVKDYKETVLENSPIFIYVLDYQQKIFTEGLANYSKLLGYTEEEISNMPDGVYSFIHPDDLNIVQEQEKALRSSDNRTVVPAEFRLQNKNGEWFWIQVHSTIYSRDADGEPIIEIGSIHKLNKDYEAELALQQKDKYYRTLVENSYDCILMYDKEGYVTYISPSVTRVTGYTPEDLLGKTLEGFIYEDDREDASVNLRYVSENPGASSVVERRIRHKDGAILWIESRLANHLDDPDIQGVTINFHVITGRKESENKIHRLTNFDSLTGLANRNLLHSCLARDIENCSDKKDQLAFMYIDLDRFKEINDTLGHATGDQLLIAVTEYMKKCIRNGDTLARMGGDEFAIILPNIDAEEAHTVAKRLLRHLKNPIKVGPHRVQTGASIGISMFPDHSDNAEDLFRYADMAMYSAKSERNQVQFYKRKYSQQESKRRMVEKKLKVAIAERQLHLFFQPRVDIHTGKIRSVEALCRWDDPESGSIPPNIFIPIAEESGLIHDLSQLVMEMVCQQLLDWHNTGIDVTIAFNLSVKDLKYFDLVHNLRDTINRYGVSGKMLEVEVTESAAMTDVINTVKVLKQLKDFGIKVSIDDFGKGYSSLAYLSQLPVDNLKIDKYFISRLSPNFKDHMVNLNIIRTIISLAESLNLNTVAEGIETPNQYNTLKSLGCNMGQGIFFYHPMPANQLSKLLQREQRLARSTISQ